MDTLVKSPGLPRAYANITEVLVNSGCYQEAVRYGNRGVRIKSDRYTFVIYYNLSLAHYHLGNYIPSYQCAKMAMELNKNNLTINLVKIIGNNTGYDVNVTKGE